MYESYFGFKESPFNLTPDPRYLFLSRYHKEALDHLLYGINERKGFIAITGGIGTGKTTLCRSLLAHLEEPTKTALIFNASITDIELLSTISQEFGYNSAPETKSKKDHIDALNCFLLDNFSKGGNAVLLIDEAQNLSHDALEQIRMLSNLETEREKLIQIVLVGQPELNGLLSSPYLRQLNERITVRYHLTPLDKRDLKGYVEHRMSVAGGRKDSRFTQRAYTLIYSYSRGNPRRINAVCDRAMLIGYAHNTHVLSGGIISRAVRDLRGHKEAGSELKEGNWRRLVPVTLLLALLIATAGLAAWSFKKPAHELLTLAGGNPASTITQGKTEKGDTKFYLDKNQGIARLFELYINNYGPGGDPDKVQMGLFSLKIGPEYYVTFKRPFLARISGTTSEDSPRYLLIREIQKGDAVAVDLRGKNRNISREFLLRHWGGEVLWLYPNKGMTLDLAEGMAGPGVFSLQNALNNLGYMVKTTGVYDKATLQQVARLQEDFGLEPDGIFGPRTRALLYQISK